MQRIEIHGYKSIKHLSLELRNVNILIGSNGSGKSNFLSFFDLLKNIYKQNLRETVALKGIEAFLFNGSEVTQAISAKLDFQNTNAYSFELTKGENGFIFTKEDMWYDNPNDINPKSICTFDFESRLKDLIYSRAPYIQKYIKSIKKYYFHDTGENSPFSKESDIENDKFILYERGENLAAFLYNMKNNHKKYYDFIVFTIQSIAPYFSDFYFEPENGRVKIRWLSKHNSTIFGVNDLSDGTLRFIALATLFLQPELPGTLVIDEPELGLHPVALGKLAGLIQSVATKGFQVIVATQSTELISYFEPEDIVTVDLIDGASDFKRLDSESLNQWLEDYISLGDLWKRNIISSGQPSY